uniref:DUF2971 domain-containing protein n=1 Tax=Rhodococcus sp. NS1 TaxID=402236 RepID=A0A097SPJ9_9NOCA|nr:hypothetical protein LRS1606.2 [Rhodococcus sp. NS1]
MEKPADAPEILWHYTDAAGLIGMLSNEDESPTVGVVGSGTFKPVLWATAAQFLNDRRELVHGLEVVRNYIQAESTHYLNHPNTPDPATKAPFFKAVVETLGNLISGDYEPMMHCYTVSLSEEGDLLSQWRGYSGGTGGFSIGFESSAFPTSKDLFPNGRGLFKVHYTSNGDMPGDLQSATRNFLAMNSWYPDSPEPTPQLMNQWVQRLAIYAARVKDIGFKEEREWRFIESSETDLPDFRGGKLGLTPFRKVPLPRTAVKAVYIGPGPAQYENYLAAKALLRRYGYTEAAQNVECSKTPFR